mmetsp:Transcript_114104/g.286720  ORF Transcript_114104/g.286720 Transcript_114104/m.286720 type:complete len:254 (+) Transcript_114104:452-1213(+)
MLQVAHIFEALPQRPCELNPHRCHGLCDPLPRSCKYLDVAHGAASSAPPTVQLLGAVRHSRINIASAQRAERTVGVLGADVVAIEAAVLFLARAAPRVINLKALHRGPRHQRHVFEAIHHVVHIPVPTAGLLLPTAAHLFIQAVAIPPYQVSELDGLPDDRAVGEVRPGRSGRAPLSVPAALTVTLILVGCALLGRRRVCAIFPRLYQRGSAVCGRIDAEQLAATGVKIVRRAAPPLARADDVVFRLGDASVA